MVEKSENLYERLKLFGLIFVSNCLITNSNIEFETELKINLNFKKVSAYNDQK